MNIDEYQQKAIDHFKSGKVTDDQWKILGKAILDASEGHEDTSALDDVIHPDWRNAPEL